MLALTQAALLVLLGTVLQVFIVDYPVLVGSATAAEVEGAATFYRTMAAARPPATLAVPAAIAVGAAGLIRALWRRPTAGLGALAVGMGAALYLFAGRVLVARAAVAALPRDSTPPRAYGPLLLDIAACHAVLVPLLVGMAAVCDSERKEAEAADAARPRKKAQ